MTEEDLAVVEAAVARGVSRALLEHRKKTARTIPPVLLTLGETADLLACSAKVVQELIRAGTLRTKKLGARVVVPLAECIRLSSVEEPQLPLALGNVPTMLTYDQAAQRLAVSRSTIERMVLSGDMAACRVGHKPRIPSTEIGRLAGTSMPGTRRRKQTTLPRANAGSKVAAFDNWYKAGLKDGSL